MPGIEKYLEKLPPQTQEMARFVWNSLPPGEKNALQLLLTGIPSDVNLIHLLVNLSSSQLQLAFGQKSRVAIIGPANVGKSTLYNQLVLHKSDHAKVSPLPGTTRDNQQADAGLFAIVDTPGADAVGDLGERERQMAFSAAAHADFIILVFDAIQGIKQTELDLYREIKALGKPYVVVLNKIDLVRRDADRVIAQAAANLGLKPEQIIPAAAKSGENLNDILLGITFAEPGMAAALGQALPQYRWQLAWRVIAGAASISAVIALAPLPVIDFAPLLVNQSVMVLGIARIYNYKITLQRARELAATFGLGFLGRMLFQQLSKLGGVPGWVLSAAIAASTTVVMGYAASVWFEQGQKVSRDTLKTLTENVTRMLLDVLKQFGQKKPSREALQQQISEALEKSVLAQNRANLEKSAGDPGVQPSDDEIVI